MVYSYELLNYQSYLQKYFSEKTKSFWIYNSVCKDKCVNVFVVNISITKHDKLYFAANSTKITLHLRFVSENQKMNQLVCINGNKCIPTIEALKGINPRHVIIKQNLVPDVARKPKKGEKQTDVWRPCVGSTDDRREYACLICKKQQQKLRIKMPAVSYKFLSNLMRHIQTMHQEAGKKNYCAMCKKYFSNKYNLKTQHNFIHKRRNRFKCSQCTITTSRRYDLIRHHKRIHVPKKNYLCGKPFEEDKQYVCGRFFRTKQSMMDHVRKHHHGSHQRILKRAKVNQRQEFIKMFKNA